VLATEALERSGVGTVSFDGATFDAVSSCHIMGTLAFGNDPATSATDPTGLLRGTDNVFAAGMCLFPTSGHSNPTLTAMALSVRVADEIVKRSLTLTPAVA
jgi:choline dehydrogenase-like flavoprotein